MTDTDPATPVTTERDLPFRRLLLVVTGAFAAVSAPETAVRLRFGYPDLAVRVLVTESALRFVTLDSLAIASGSPTIQIDRWERGNERSLHADLASWSDACLVLPCTVGFLGRLAAGLCDSPSQIAILSNRFPTALAVSYPPGTETSPIVARNLRTLVDAGIDVVPSVPGWSIDAQNAQSFAPPAIDACLDRLAHLRHRWTEA